MTTFIADEKVFFGVGISNYDAVWEVYIKRKDIFGCRQTMPDIPTASTDCEEMKELLEKYDFDLKVARRRDAALGCDPN